MSKHGLLRFGARFENRLPARVRVPCSLKLRSSNGGQDDVHKAVDARLEPPTLYQWYIDPVMFQSLRCNIALYIIYIYIHVYNIYIYAYHYIYICIYIYTDTKLTSKTLYCPSARKHGPGADALLEHHSGAGGLDAGQHALDIFRIRV